MSNQEDSVRSYLVECHPAAVELLLKVRKALLQYLPEHEEKLGWKAVAFYKPDPKTSVKDCICYLRTQRKNVLLVIPLGVFFDDPHKLLEGDLRYKRQITIKTLEDFEHPGIKDIVLQSVAFDSTQTLYKLLPNADYREMASKI